jgi:hypothetical protein
MESSKEPTVATKNETVELQFPAALLKTARAKLEKNGLDVNTLLRLCLRSYVGLPDQFDLETTLTFGRYRDERTRRDPDRPSVQGFHLSKRAEKLLVEISGDPEITKPQTDGE